MTIYPGKLAGTIPAIPSKSAAHRLLIAAALADGPTEIACPSVSQDILATARCLAALGAGIDRTEWGFTVTPEVPLPSSGGSACGGCCGACGSHQ